jgi:hypothetical protein
MTVPEPRRGFMDRVVSRAVASARRESRATSALGPFGRWETWLGAAIGAAAAVLVTVAILRPQIQEVPAAAVTLAVNEARHIDVVIDSERTLEDATIRLATTGVVQLEGFENQHEVEWQARLERGRNVLSLPVVARKPGRAELVAVVEHEGRSRRIAVHLIVKPRGADKENV